MSLFNTLSKSMKTSKNIFDFKDLLHNNVLLYGFLFMSLMTMFYFANTGDNRSIAIFVIIGFLTSFFSKNMIVILMLSLVITHIFKYGLSSVSEGVANKEDASDEEGEEDEEKEGFEGGGEEEEKEDKEEDGDEEKPKKGKEPMDAKNATADKKKDYEEFQKLQEGILDGMKKLEPLITKAESYVEKYEAKDGGNK